MTVRDSLRCTGSLVECLTFSLPNIWSPFGQMVTPPPDTDSRTTVKMRNYALNNNSVYFVLVFDV